MALDTYDDLYQAVSDWLNRIDLEEHIPVFIQGSEGRIASDLEIADLPRLSNDVPTNWLLEMQPDIYLYGSLCQAAPYLGDDARIATWSALYKRSVDSADAKLKGMNDE